MNNSSQNKKVNITFYDNTTETKKDVLLQKVSDNSSLIGHNKPSAVYFDGKYGFFKNSSHTSKSVLDKYEYIICQLGKKLNIKMAETYKVYSDNNFTGIISESVLDSNDEKMFLAKDIYKLIQNPDTNLINYINSIKQLALNNNRIFKRSNNDIWNIPNIDRDEDIDSVIEVFPTLIKKIEPDLHRQNEIIHDYYNMLMLDIITNNVDRNNNNYSLVLDSNNNFRFAHLFDNSTIHIPGLPDNKRRVNGFMIDRDKLLNALFKNHYNDIEYIAKLCSNNKNELINYTRKLCNDNLEQDEANAFLTPITQNIFSVCNFQKMKENNQLDKNSFLEQNI